MRNVKINNTNFGNNSDITSDLGCGLYEEGSDECALRDNAANAASSALTISVLQLLLLLGPAFCVIRDSDYVKNLRYLKLSLFLLVGIEVAGMICCFICIGNYRAFLLGATSFTNTQNDYYYYLEWTFLWPWVLTLMSGIFYIFLITSMAGCIFFLGRLERMNNGSLQEALVVSPLPAPSPLSAVVVTPSGRVIGIVQPQPQVYVSAPGTYAQPPAATQNV